MASWVLAQQVALSLTLGILIAMEKWGAKYFDGLALYRLWCLLPLTLLVNNLPQDLLPIGQTGLHQYLVNFNHSTQDYLVWLNWELCWSAGFITIMAYTLSQHWKIKGLIQHETAASNLPVPLPDNIRVMRTDHFRSPALFGIWRPILLLPYGFEQQFSPLQQKLILQHELVHYLRADNVFNALAMIFVAVFWFNPLIWLAYLAFRRSQEMACDHTVLAGKQPSDKLAYSQALIMCLSYPNPQFYYSQYGAKNTMINRIKAIQHQPAGKVHSIIFSTLLGCSLLSGITLANQSQSVVDLSTINEASPVYRIEPKYPVLAAQKNIEGSVLLQFDIAKDGTTSNIKVIKADPIEIFDKVSIKALEQWRYKPQIIGGQAQTQTNLLVQLDYRMDENPSPIKPLIEGISVLR